MPDLFDPILQVRDFEIFLLNKTEEPRESSKIRLKF
jgi:hypothetical protein